MSLTTNVPLPTFADAGPSTPSEPAILTGVMADFVAAFGGALNPSIVTPQGQLGQSLTAIIGAFNDLFVEYCNQADPAFASGRMQDALARIYFLTRLQAGPTTVTATCSGATGTTLQIGSLALATDGTIYASLEAATIPSGGSVDVAFAALTNGPIACPAGALSQIYRSVAGWDSVVNAADGVPGRLTETAAELETRRRLTVSQNATAIVAAMRGWLLGSKTDGSPVVPGIVDAWVQENDTGSSVTVDGVTIAANSVFVCVQGGSSADIARAIWQKKSLGCGLVGSTTVVVTDSESGYLSPPSYSIKFQRATALPIDYAVTIQNKPDVPSDYLAQITAALAAAFPAQARIAQTIYALGGVGAIAALGPWARLVSIEVNGDPEQAVGIDEFPTFGAVTASLV